MKNTKIAAKCKIAYAFVIGLSLLIATAAEDPYIFYEWHVTYGTISPMGFNNRYLLCLPNRLCISFANWMIMSYFLSFR
ncbi:hypothetical protein HID58_022022 [Brassica napus]|uniref:Uncharacterized protein n=1 Tax=Brassica napus TaxID=3708 RepID=A0ABQ8CY35_BRANA|nr:hypothetical protein HID58_022022 [Brassica napus]